jgi:hypothetical protein
MIYNVGQQSQLLDLIVWAGKQKGEAKFTQLNKLR